LPNSERCRTPSGNALTALILDLLGAASAMHVVGDRLVAGLGLTSARWQVLGRIMASDRPQPVAWLARDMGANRQNIQRIVNDLVADGMLALTPNPHHRRAHLVVLTERGREAFDAAMRLQAPWVNRLAEDLTLEDLAATHRVVGALRARLASEGEGGMES
jgi:DNA-binding MarR family transcriptional regulator